MGMMKLLHFFENPKKLIDQLVSRWWFYFDFLMFTRNFWEDEPNLTSIFSFFQMGWNHQPDDVDLVEIFSNSKLHCLVDVVVFFLVGESTWFR